MRACRACSLRTPPTALFPPALLAHTADTHPTRAPASPLLCSCYALIAQNLARSALLAAALAACSSYVAAQPARVAAASGAAYWLLLGILSSVGLGSGLHTFVLFLGPHIVRVATVALRHGRLDFSADIARYFAAPAALSVAALSAAFSPTYAADAWLPAASTGGTAPPAVGVLAIAAKVAGPAILWGIGTAIGELPPYFIARAARQVRPWEAEGCVRAGQLLLQGRVFASLFYCARWQSHPLSLFLPLSPSLSLCLSLCCLPCV